MGEMLSEHFSVAEFTYSDTAKAKGIDNSMNEAQLKEAKHTAVYMLEPIRKLLNDTYKTYGGKSVKCVTMRITSGFRCLKLNRAIGSKDTSQHVKSQACDLEATIMFKDGSKKVLPYTELYSTIKKAVKTGKLVIDQCIQEKNGNTVWLHCSLSNQIKDARKQFLIYKNGVYTLDN